MCSAADTIAGHWRAHVVQRAHTLMFDDWLANARASGATDPHSPELAPTLFLPRVIVDRDGATIPYPEFLRFTHLTVASLFPYMTPTDDFPEAECLALRLAIVSSMEAIELHFHFHKGSFVGDRWLQALLTAVRAGSAGAGGRVTDFVRHLDVYLEGVVRRGELCAPEGAAAKEGLGLFAVVIEDCLSAVQRDAMQVAMRMLHDTCDRELDAFGSYTGA